MLLHTVRSIARHSAGSRGFSSKPYSIVKDAIVGIRLVSEKKCEPGATFSEFNRVTSEKRTQHSLWDALNEVNYVAKTDDDHIPYYLEHHPQPNLRIAHDSQSVVATRAIRPGDFLTLDYADTEPSLFSQFPAVLADPPLLRPWTTGAHEEINDDGKQWLNIETSPQKLLPSCHAGYDSRGRMMFHDIDLLSEAWTFDPDIPLYLYSKEAMRLNLYRISYYLQKHFDRSELFYSVKSNSSPEVLCELRHAGQPRLDVCSPQELDMGRRCGFDVRDMQYTGTNLSDNDWMRLMRHPDLAINVDSMSALERTPLRKHVGLRLDPNVGMSYQGNESLQCTCASKPTKMGFLLSEIRQACDLARRRGVHLERIHAHVGNSFHTDDMGPFDGILAQVQKAIEICEDEGFDITQVNLGGGYGVPYLPNEETFDWDAWASRVAKYPAIASKRVQIEPGDSIVKNAGVMLARVTDVFQKAGTDFVGVNAGMNLNPLPAYYGVASYPYPALRREEGDSLPSVSVVGNLNESVDVWCEDVCMTPVRVGDHLVLFNSGGYAHSCRTNHSLRSDFNILLV